MKMRLRDAARVIRSKNSGPYEPTFDIIFNDRETYEKAVEAGVISRELISALYSVDIGDVRDVVNFTQANAIKATVRRRVVSGAVGDTDIYGAQQHAPLLNLVIDI